MCLRNYCWKPFNIARHSFEIDETVVAVVASVIEYPISTHQESGTRSKLTANKVSLFFSRSFR